MTGVATIFIYPRRGTRPSSTRLRLSAPPRMLMFVHTRGAYYGTRGTFVRTATRNSDRRGYLYNDGKTLSAQSSLSLRPDDLLCRPSAPAFSFFPFPTPRPLSPSFLSRAKTNRSPRVIDASRSRKDQWREMPFSLLRAPVRRREDNTNFTFYQLQEMVFGEETVHALFIGQSAC